MEHASFWTQRLHAAGLSLPDEIVMATLVFLFLCAVAVLGGRKLSLTSPGKLQQVLELLVGGFANLLESTIPHHGRKHLRMIGAFGCFILVGNLFGMIPTLAAPTTSYSVTLTLALISFVYYNQAALRQVGFLHYVKHFLGPVLWLGPFMLVIEVIGHLARIVSLSVRLFGNMYGEHSASAVFYSFAGGFLIPVPLMALGVFAALLQTFVFVLLSMVYIALATEEH